MVNYVFLIYFVGSDSCVNLPIYYFIVIKVNIVSAKNHSV